MVWHGVRSTYMEAARLVGTAGMGGGSAYV